MTSPPDSQKLPKITLLNISHLRNHMLPQHRIEAETSLEKWTRAKTDKGRTTHLATSRSFNLAYWQGYRAAILNLQDALNNAKDAEDATVIGNRSGHTPKAISMTEQTRDYGRARMPKGRWETVDPYSFP
jgi:hypothetical protein